MAENITNATPRVRPRQVLLVGLGGVGSRTVDKVLSIMPKEYKRYTRAVAIDTDIGDLNKELKYIPENNRIALGSNPDTKQSITIGDYIRNHPRTTDWFVKGDKLDLIEGRSTTQGAKQIRMVSRIALAATNEFCGMKNVLDQVIRQFNEDDGSVGGSGLLVMIVCSIAGGTGAGTVLQFPLYLEQVLAELFSDEDVQIDCSMLLPDMFRRVQSSENYLAGKANAYAVVRELMALNARKLKRGDMIAEADLEVKKENIAPFGRVLFFDSTSMAGDTLNGDLDHTYIPKVASSLNEYLFGPVNGKITSALDNTLRRVYDSDGQAIFGSVGTSKLIFPRATYIQYATANWISKAVAKQWLDIDREAKRLYKEEFKKAVENDTQKPDEKKRTRELYCQLLEEKTDRFYKEVLSRYKVEKPKNQENEANEEIENIVQLFWQQCSDYLDGKKYYNEEYKTAKDTFEINYKSSKIAKKQLVEFLEKYDKAANKLVDTGVIYAKQVLRTSEAEDGSLYKKHNDESTLFGFIKSKKLHPLAIRYFLYKLCDVLEENKEYSNVTVNYEKINEYKKLNGECKELLSKEGGAIESNVYNDMLAAFANTMLKEIDLYLEELEEMFKMLDVVIRKVENNKILCKKQLPLINQESGLILAGGNLSMMYTWRKIEDEISAGDDAFTIDDELNGKIHETVYKAFIEQVLDRDNVKNADEYIKIRTRYEDLVGDELQKYYTIKLFKNYSHRFPETVIDAALLQCGLENAYKRELAGVDANVEYNFSKFIDRNPVPYNIKVSEPGLVTDAEYLDNLLNALVGKGKPFCGRVESLGRGQDPVINRLLAINRKMLRTKEDTLDIDEYGVPKKVYIEDEIIEGVSSSRVGNFDINTKFVDEGISADEIISVTTVAGLEPKAFVSFLPPDGNEHSPTKEQSYYAAYSEFIDELPLNKGCITPHLHWKWHMAGMLSDLTSEHTDTYSKQAAEAFMYGFIFDVIKVVEDGIVEIGLRGETLFSNIFDGKYTKEFELLDKNTHSVIDELPAAEKRNTMNTLLVKIYELLATSAPIRDAIITYGERVMEDYKLKKSNKFVGFALTGEKLGKELSYIYYECIIDVLAGYYVGTRNLSAKEIERADSNADYMFDFLMKKTFEVAQFITDYDDSATRDMYLNFVNLYYNRAVIDDGVGFNTTEETATGAEINLDNLEVKSEDLAYDWDSAGDDRDKQSLELLQMLTMPVAKSVSNPFARGRFDRKSALEMVENFMDKNN